MKFQRFEKEFNHGDVDIQTGEEWRDVKGYEGLYMVSSHGRVISLPKQHGAQFFKWTQLLRQKKTSSGYLTINLKYNGKRKHPVVHRLVAKAFIPNPHNKKFVNHINGDKADNRVENLEWVTNQENMDHAVETGLLRVKGEHNPAAKLTEKDVMAILRSKQSGLKLSKKYNICPATVYHIRSGRIWTSVTGLKNIRKR